jgi:beta-mannosidase
LLDHFMDLSYAYRFGPLPCDAVDATLRGAGGERLAQAFHFPGGLSAIAQADVGLAATVTRTEDGLAQLSLRSDRLALAVHFEVPGFTPDQEHFHLAPGDEVQITLRGTGVLPTGGLVHALNSIKPARIAPAAGPRTETKN